MLTIKIQKKHVEYSCKVCDYVTRKKGNYTAHLDTAKHKELTASSKPLTDGHVCSICSKVYNSRVGLWGHKKKCLASVPANDSSTSITPLPSQPPPLPEQQAVVIHPFAQVIDVSMLMNVFRENNEIKTILCEQSKHAMEIQEKQSMQIAELQEKQSAILMEFKKESNELFNKLIEREPTVNNNNTTNNNQKFNLNVFLNETCKDAMNMEDFLANLQFTFEDLVKFGDHGFVDGMAQFLIKELSKLDVTKRPIHCTDIRRDVIHLKDNNVWKKDTGQQLAAAIKRVEFKSVVALNKWRVETPDANINNSPNNLLRDKIYMQTLLGDDDTRSKVIKLLNKAFYLSRYDH
jgi:hypothetical protein